MTHPLTTGCLLFPLVAAIGCASVPEVESRLSALQFHPNMYVVQAGDTLDSIAYRYLLSPEQIARLNPGIEGTLTPGLRINVHPGTDLPEAVRVRTDRREPGGGASVRVEPPVAIRAPAPVPVVVSPVTRPPAPTPIDDEIAFVPSGTSPRGAGADGRDGALDAPGYPREEIVPDDLDLGSADPRAALDEELQRYVGRWTWPTDGAVARGFAPGQPNGQGVDIAGVPGQDVRAALDGTVVYSGRDLSGGGNLVIVRHDDELMTTYSHTDRLFVAEDDKVLAGDPIASLGWNGERESVLRFEVRRDGEPLDPMVFLSASP